MSFVVLKNRHLFIAAELALQAFGNAAQVYVVYYPTRQALLLAPMEDKIFPTLHKAGLQMLKTRNLQGDKSISLEETLIDHDLDNTDRPLAFNHVPNVPLLHVTL